MPATQRTAVLPAVPALRREPVGLEVSGVLLSVAGLLLGSAVVTLAPEGAARPLANVTGSLGRTVADGLTRALGAGAYLFAAFPVLWGVSCIRGRAPRALARKALLVPLLAVLVAALASLVFGRLPVPGLHRSGPGGYLGLALHGVLFGALGRGASLLVAGLAGATLLLVTDLRFRGLRRRDPEAGVAVLDREEDGEDAEAGAGDERAPGAGPSGEDDEDGERPAPEKRRSRARPAAAGAGPTSDEEDDEDDEEDEPRAPARAAAPAAAPLPVFRAVAPPPRPAPRPKKPAPLPRRPGAYEFPPSSLLEPGEPSDPANVREEIEQNAATLGATLRSFGVEATVVAQRRGPVITFFELEVGAGIRLSSITKLSEDLAIALKAPSVRIVAPIPGKSTVGVEVPNIARDTVRLLELVEEAGDRTSRRAIPLFLGRDTSGEPIVEDLAQMPHVLIAGATGSGKSVCVNSILLSILFTRTPDEVKLVLIDPKQVELTFFDGLPHLLTPVVTNMKRAAQILEWAVARMEERYELFARFGARNIGGYNALGAERIATLREAHTFGPDRAPDLLPYLVLVVDELADLMMTSGKEVELSITRLAQKSRAVGIHIILATQRPSTDVITGLIKANMPTRLAFKVSSKIDSRVILDQSGADKLLGMGDMLYLPPRTSNLRRAQGTFISDAEVRNVVEFVRKKSGPVDYQDLFTDTSGELGDPNEEDDLYDDSVRSVLATKLGSASMLQRKFGIGYTRASRLIDMMCDRGVVGPHKGSKARELLTTLEEWEATHGAASGETPRPSALAVVEEDGPLGVSDEEDGIAGHGSGTKPADVGSPWD